MGRYICFAIHCKFPSVLRLWKIIFTGIISLSTNCDDDENQVDYEHSDDEDAPRPPSKSSKCTSKAKPIFLCPECSKEYKSRSGFQSHVLNKHDGLQIKATDNIKQQGEERTAFTPPSKRPPPATATTVPLSTLDDVRVSLEKAIPNALTAIIRDEHHNSSFSRMGSRMISIAAELQISDVQELLDVLSPNLHSVIGHLGQGPSLSRDRERMWTTFHRICTDDGVAKSVVDIVSKSTTETVSVITLFVQVFFDELIDHLLSEMSNKMSEISSQPDADVLLSDSDQAVLYHLAGYIVHALPKKCKAKLNQAGPIVHAMEQYGPSQGFIQKFSHWSKKKDRGGLKQPADDFFLLVRQLEMLLRKSVDLKYLTASSLICEKLEENLMSDFLVNYYWDKIHLSEDNIKLFVLEQVIKLFLKMRGHAVTKLVKKKLLFAKKCEKRKQRAAKSLRKSLQDSSSSVK